MTTSKADEATHDAPPMEAIEAKNDFRSLRKFLRQYERFAFNPAPTHCNGQETSNVGLVATIIVVIILLSNIAASIREAWLSEPPSSITQTRRDLQVAMPLLRIVEPGMDLDGIRPFEYEGEWIQCRGPICDPPRSIPTSSCIIRSSISEATEGVCLGSYTVDGGGGEEVTLSGSYAETLQTRSFVRLKIRICNSSNPACPTVAVLHQGLERSLFGLFLGQDLAFALSTSVSANLVAEASVRVMLDRTTRVELANYLWRFSDNKTYFFGLANQLAFVRRFYTSLGSASGGAAASAGGTADRSDADGRTILQIDFGLSGREITTTVQATSIFDLFGSWGALYGTLLRVLGLVAVEYNRRKFFRKNPGWMGFDRNFKNDQTKLISADEFEDNMELMLTECDAMRLEIETLSLKMDQMGYPKAPPLEAKK